MVYKVSCTTARAVNKEILPQKKKNPNKQEKSYLNKQTNKKPKTGFWTEGMTQAGSIHSTHGGLQPSVPPVPGI